MELNNPMIHIIVFWVKAGRTHKVNPDKKVSPISFNPGVNNTGNLAWK